MKYFGLFLISVLSLNNLSNATEDISFTKKLKPLKNQQLRFNNDEWWQNAVIYQIYPRSFKDSDNDGNGDLQGIIQMLDHFTDMDVDGFWLSPIYKSPQVDNGYDISDYRDIDEMYGSLDDLRQLVDEAHKRDLKVILDYVPNHTSDQHEWFQASLKGISPYDDYYIWRNATHLNGERRPPNNWLSGFRGSAWKWSEERQQYYYHQFASAQPDLNYRNPKVVEEMKDVLRYWLNFGVDGFRMDAVSTLFEDVLLRDEPLSGATGLQPDDPRTLEHIYTNDLNETYDMIYQFRELLDEFNEKNRSYTRIMMTEVYSDIETTMLYYGDQGRPGAHFTFNFITFILDTKKGFTPIDLTTNIAMWDWYLPAGCTSNWVLGNHDRPRVATRLGVENIDALNILVAILPGVQITYQGEEIGQENGEVTCEQGYDPQAIKNCSTFNETSRDFERTPFQWSNSTNAGFNKGNTTWLPVSKKFIDTNLASQNISGIMSHYNIYKTMVQIRKEFKNTTSDTISVGSAGGNIFYAQRTTDYADYILIINTGDYEDGITRRFIENSTLEVVLTNIGSQYSVGDTFNLSQPLRPGETVFSRVFTLG